MAAPLLLAALLLAGLAGAGLPEARLALVVCPPCHPPDDAVLCTLRFVMDFAGDMLGHGCG